LKSTKQPFWIILGLVLAYKLPISIAQIPAGTESQIDQPQASSSEINMDECDRKLREQLTELIKKDKKGILGQQFKVTTLKLLKRTAASQKTTLENLIKAENTKLQAFNSQDPEVLKKLEELYDENSREQARDVLAHAEELKGKSASLSYTDSKKRLKNDDISSYLLMEKISKSDSDITKMDISITWYFEKLTAEVEKTKGKNSIMANMTELSPQLARYTGVIPGTDKMSVAQIDKELKASEAAVKKFLADAMIQIKQNISECFPGDKWKGNCDLTEATLNEELSNILYTLDNVSSELGTQLVTKITRQDNVPIPKPEPVVVKTVASKSSTSNKPSASSKKKNTCGVEEKVGPANCIDLVRGMEGIEHLQKLLSSGASGVTNGSHASKGNFEVKFCEKKITECCGSKVNYATEQEIELGFGFSWQVSMYYGVPYGAELGIRGKLFVGLNGKLQHEFNACHAKASCGSLGLKVEPALAVYAEVLAGLAGAEGGVKWNPNITAKQCFAKPMPKMSFVASWGELKVYYLLTGAWIFTTEGEAVVYDFGSSDTYYAQIF
jgi:hypothetical protein